MYDNNNYEFLTMPVTIHANYVQLANKSPSMVVEQFASFWDSRYQHSERFVDVSAEAQSIALA
jgi:hypothetical protein